MSLVLAGCQGSRTDVGAWSAPPSDRTPKKWVRISDDPVRFVRPEKLSTAESLLKDESIRALSMNELEGLVGAEGDNAGSWYLVRGMSAKGSTKAWSAERSENGDALWVDWGKLWYDIRPVNNPILVMLDSRPSRVFVTAGVAE
jgi:hypothetical protein